MFGKGYRRNRTPGRWIREPARLPVPERAPLQVGAITARRLQTPRPPIQDRVDRLDETLKTLDPYLQEPAASAGALVNPLLVVWDAAHAVHPEVATPVEKLLTGLLHRTTVPVDDVLVAVEDMRARALQVLVLTGRVVVG